MPGIFKCSHHCKFSSHKRTSFIRHQSKLHSNSETKKKNKPIVLGLPVVEHEEVEADYDEIIFDDQPKYQEEGRND